MGGILQPGDTVLGYLISRANFNSDDFEALDAGRVPDVILVKKTYPNRRKKHRARGWRLKSIAKEANEEGDGEGPVQGRGALGRRGGLDQAKVEADYEAFLQELEEDPELRATVNLYKAEGKEKEADAAVAAAKAKKGPAGKKGQYAMEGVEAAEEEGDEEEGDFPEVKLEELMEELTVEDEE